MPVKRHVCATRPQIVIAGTMNFNMQYVYSTTQNNGQITQPIDGVSGETIDYAYDSLNRLITAATTGPQWGLSFGYDGFGNRLTQTVTKGSGPLDPKTGTGAISDKLTKKCFTGDQWK
jgi:YD repeat-containing protein